MTVIGVLPLMLAGGLIVQIEQDIPLGAAGLGQAVLGFGIASIVLSIPLGRLVDRIGATLSMRLACMGAAIVSSGIALTAWTRTAFTLWLIAGGAVGALSQPAVDRFLVVAVNAWRQGQAFGIRQAAYPGASVVAGLAVPLVGLTVGWRWAYAAGALAAVIGGIAVPAVDRLEKQHAPAPGGHARQAPAGLPRTSMLVLVVLAVACGLGYAGHTNLSFFVVGSAVDAGFGEGSAGLLLSAGSICAMTARLVVGRFADGLRAGHLLVVAGMLAAGAAGYGLMATGARTPMLLGALVAFTLGWGWAGLFMFAVVRVNQAAPGTATGVVHAGGGLGSSVGPALFGMVAERYSFGMAWLGAAGVTLATVAVLVVAQRLLERDEQLPSFD